MEHSTTYGAVPPQRDHRRVRRVPSLLLVSSMGVWWIACKARAPGKVMGEKEKAPIAATGETGQIQRQKARKARQRPKRKREGKGTAAAAEKERNKDKPEGNT